MEWSGDDDDDDNSCGTEDSDDWMVDTTHLKSERPKINFSDVRGNTDLIMTHIQMDLQLAD